ncbi:DNA methyltransferase [Bacillus haynesii]|uniref:DNA methyltransferase n=1 Tax=Bacillus haynesii TaxID=1925021 RepID=UPI001EFBAD3B|nr:site-specific DNA-methyltransferase [Bacillus haynesii]
MEICRHCGGDIKDYGGYKNKLNSRGLNLTDVWHDISPVRHSKYKTRESNELPLKLMERIISMASEEGDVVFDPFGGSGTTYIVSEILKRRWIGSEIGPIDSIIKRFEDIDFHRDQIKEIQAKKNILFTDEMKKIRRKNGHWLPETLETAKKNKSKKLTNK